MKPLGCIAAVLIVFVIGPIESGFVLSLLWGWFIVPLHVAQIGIAWAIGIALLIRMLTYQTPSEQERKDAQSDNALWSVCGWSLGYPLIVLLFGYTAHLFM